MKNILQNTLQNPLQDCQGHPKEERSGKLSQEEAKETCLLHVMWILVGILGQKKVKTEGIWGFPDGSVGKESTCNAGNPGDVGLIPGMGRSPGEGNGNPLQYSCLENPMDGGAMKGCYSPWGRKESDMTEPLHFQRRLKEKGISIRFREQQTKTILYLEIYFLYIHLSLISL